MKGGTRRLFVTGNPADGYYLAVRWQGDVYVRGGDEKVKAARGWNRMSQVVIDPEPPPRGAPSISVRIQGRVYEFRKRRVF